MSALALSAVVAAGCSGDNAGAPPPSTAAAAPVTAAAAPAVAPGDFGVPACDSYMRKYTACVESKVPEQGRAMMRQSIEQTRAAWKQAASTPQGRDGLALGCTQAETAAKQAMAAYGCSW
jgi:hypothetical protein